MSVDFPNGFRFGASGGVSENEDFCGDTGNNNSCDKRDFAWKIYGGYQFLKWIGVEGGYVDLGDVDTLGPGGALGDRTDLETQGIAVAVVVTAPVLEKAGIFGKVGGLYWDQEGKVQTHGLPTQSFSDEGGSFMWGLGFRFPFNDRFGIVFEYEEYLDVGEKKTGESDIPVWSGGFIWQFGG